MNRYLKSGILFLLWLLIAPGSFGQFIHQLPGPVFPWTKAPQVKGDEFRFVIIGDLTGGEIDGVFSSVIGKINDLSPDFVMCVGDLVDGYTIDSTIMKKQWKSFHERIDRLKTPFIYMPGNHDIANNMLYNYWKKQFGHDYFSFTIGHSLFLIINVLKPGQEGIDDEQAAYIRKVLATHGTKDPVYVFSHPPLWDLFEQKGLKEIAPLLNSCNTTFFCGDRHHFIHKVVSGRSHYMLAETGMKADNTHLPLGVFNHIFWATASSNGLSIANILTDGIISPSIVNDDTEKQVNMLLGRNWFSLEPTFSREPVAGGFHSRLILRNQGDFPLQVTGGFAKRKNLLFKPDSITLTVPANESVAIPVSMGNPENLSIDQLPPTEMRLTGTFKQQEKEISNTARKSWIIDHLRLCQSVKIEPLEIACYLPGMVEESWSWSGPEDGSFRFTVSHDKTNIYLKIIAGDDILIVDTLNQDHLKDQLFIHFTPDTCFQNQEKVIVEMAGGEKARVHCTAGKLRKSLTGKCIIQDGSIIANVTIPMENLKSPFFRINIGFRDQDDTTSSDQSVIWWKPVWHSKDDYPNSGLFKME